MVERAGWKPIAARRADHAERRFIASGSSIAIVDARGAFEDGLAAVGALSDPAEANAAALLTLISRNDVSRIEDMFENGATHYLASPFGEHELIQALRFAERYASRLGKTFQHDRSRTDRTPLEVSWQTAATDDQITISPALAEIMKLDADSMPKENFLDNLGDVGRNEGEAALQRIEKDGHPTAFAHTLSGDQAMRMIHHLSKNNEVIVARVELPDRDVENKSLDMRDYLTGLGDARKARYWIDNQLQSAEHQDSPKLALLLFSLHRFDMINASFGQGAGDAVLQGMARRVEKLVGPTPGRKRLIARLAGAEFIVGLSAPTSQQEAVILARQLTREIEKPFVTDDQPIQLQMRCGIVIANEEDGDAATLLRRASAALADARGKDGNSISIHGVEETDLAARANRLEIDLRPALSQDEIEILFQPQVSTTTGEILGVEALSRWRHPDYGELGAAALFAAAEGADYLPELSAHVQRKALQVAARWPDELQALRLAINVTAGEIADPDFVERFASMVDEAMFPRERLTVEVTETGLIADLEEAGKRLVELRADDFRVAIDDFGTGYSSLAYLKALPLDYLKIDRRLSEDITGSSRDRVVVRGVIEMARSLDITVIAEGVETEEQLALLAQEGCALYQGFLCSPPINKDALVELVAGRSNSSPAK